MDKEILNNSSQSAGFCDGEFKNISLNFIDKALENNYRKQYFINSIKTFRISMFTVILLYAAFGLLDYSTSPDHYKEFYTIRFFIVIPFLTVAYVLSFFSFFKTYWQLIVSAGLILAGSGIIYMLLIHPTNIYYYGGMFLVFMGGYFFIKLRFFPALVSGIGLIFIYNIGTIAFYEIFNIQNINWIAANAFFISANIICVIGLYSIERLERIDFIRKHLLKEKQDEIEKINQSLEKQVSERTKLLDNRNEKLNNEIIARKNIEKKLIKSKEKAEESDRLKTAFLANMSHEIRTPMNGILGFTELLKEPDLTGQEKGKYLEIIQKSGDRMLSTVNDIIEVSKIETGLLKAQYSNISINELLEDLLYFFELEVNNKGMDLKLHTDLENDDAIIRTDQSMLLSVMTNLVKNAIKYSNKGCLEFGYTTKNNRLLFYVKDEGIGIPLEKQKDIFNRFIQANDDKSIAVEGSGLGLSISKAYIELLGGKIWVESEVDKGTCFYCSHPYERMVIIKPVKKEAQVKIEDNTILKGKSVLIVEDEEYVYEYLKQILVKQKFTLEWAKNGLEAVQFCSNENHFDVILMDINMPVMDGYEATKQIKEMSPGIPIIAQTAFAIKGDREKIIDAGCDDYVSKPINPDLLLETIAKHI